MAHDAPYRERKTWLIKVAEVSGMKLKVYGIVGDGAAITDATVASAIDHIERHADFGGASNYGFVVMHHGEEAMWLLVDWWNEDILHQRLFYAPLEEVNNFRPGPPDHELACVWELLVIGHERDAWVKHTMMDPEKADFEAYLADAFSIA